MRCVALCCVAKEMASVLVDARLDGRTLTRNFPCVFDAGQNRVQVLQGKRTGLSFARRHGLFLPHVLQRGSSVSNSLDVLYWNFGMDWWQTP